ncbi:ABC transporter ATP-binding protein [Haloarchaeobius sp. DT45]|uniref:ABC transporter ATP-binding protein n=1 Tax=Haloarchaeobius sp. DT45 TaxID=3446116 RepID=UPI003F6C9137
MAADAPIQTPADTRGETRSQAVVVARNIQKDFGDVAVLDGVDCAVDAGEVTLLVGPNGTGKSILLACLAGGLFPDSGEVSVFGGDPHDAATDLFMLTQGGLALPDLTGRETLDFYTSLHPAATDRWESVAERLGLAGALDRPIRDYSGGMVRKLELTVALAMDVPLLLLDEPTAELDASTVETVHGLLRERAAAGTAVVLTSHLPRDLDLADHVLVMRDGRVSATGSPEALLAAVPPVVSLQRSSDLDAVRSSLLGETLLERDAAWRGFCAPDVAPETLRERFEHVRIRTDPTFADLFDFYTTVAESSPDRSQDGQRNVETTPGE